MAEGFARHLVKGRVDVYSAGLIAAGVNRYAMKVMKEKGIDISNQISEEIDEALLGKMDIIITLCGHAEASCPATPPHIRRYHWPVDDPVGTIGTEKEILAAFRKTRDEIEEKVRTFLETLA